MICFAEDRDRVLRVAETMAKHGGWFERKLADLIIWADRDNLERIEAGWPELIERFEPENWK